MQDIFPCGITQIEGELLYQAAEKVHREPQNTRECILRAMQTFDHQAHNTEIANRTRELFPNYPGLSTRKIDNYLQRMAKEEKIQKISPAVYALHETVIVDLKKTQDTQEDKPEILSQIEKTSVGLVVKSKDEILLLRNRSLFRELDPSGGKETILKAAAIIIEALEMLPEPKSLCELYLNLEEFHWLREWGWKVEPHDLRTFLEGYSEQITTKSGENYSYIICIGVLLTLWCAEVGRREAQESTLWPFIRGFINPDCQSLLFQGNQGTSPYLKETIEATCRRLNLRHVFGQEGVQSYYLSIFLQFGFTAIGFKSLPFWLTGYKCTSSIEYLLNSHHRSDSFEMLWHGLREYRFGNISKEQTREIIEFNPWILPGMADSLLSQVLEKSYLRPMTSTPTNQPIQPVKPATVFELSETPVVVQKKKASEFLAHDFDIPFLGSPQLIWDPPSDPIFLCPLINLEFLDLEVGEYHIFAGDDILATLFHQSDGAYEISRAISFSCQSLHHTVLLMDNNGTPISFQELTLWEPDEDLGVLVFDCLSGNKIDIGTTQMFTNRSYYLITSSDFTIDPTSTIWRLIGDSNWQLSLIQKNWEEHLRVVIDGNVYWEPLGPKSNSSQKPEIIWGRSIQARLQSDQTFVWGQQIRLKLIDIPEYGVLL